MADKLMFPIGFDLKTGIEQAAKDWEKSYAGRLANLIKKNPVKVKLKIDVTDPKALEDVKRRIESLKLEPITPETKAAIKELAAELRTLAAALKEVQKYSTGRVTASPDAVRAARMSGRAEIDRQKALEIAERRAQKAALAEAKLARERERGVSSIHKSNAAMRVQSSYIERLIKRMAVYTSFAAFGSFLTKIREVTAEFELQRVSLGAIIQDQNRANQLFAQIQSFALQSPLSILDLTRYTKQVAAYRIETDKLFDTTKRLADVSVGLGVDMGRLVLAYGQVKAASYLRASEIRQFTEAGIPLLELLAKKFSDLQGKMVSTEQVMDLVSKRAVSFEMVAEIFQDMTDKGGMFYNMQEKQSQTLFGMWAKLGDAASVMYDEIGNTDSVNWAMKGAISLLENLMRNWRQAATALSSGLLALGGLKIYKVFNKWNKEIAASREAALKRVQVATERLEIAETVEADAARRGVAADIAKAEASTKRAQATLMSAEAELKAANATTAWTRAWGKLKSLLIGMGWTAIIVAIGTLISYIYDAIAGANRLKNALAEIKEEGAVTMEKSINGFKILADQAVNAADGSRQQQEALEELKRTYKDMIPVQDLTIDKLREMRGNYEQLNVAIREYIAQQTLQRQIDTITTEMAKKVNDLSRMFTKRVSDMLDIPEQHAQVVLQRLKDLAKDETKSIREIIRQAIEEGIGIVPTVMDVENINVLARGFAGIGAHHVDELVFALRGMDNEIKKVTEDMESQIAMFGAFALSYKETKDIIDKTIADGLRDAEGALIDPKTYLYDRTKANLQIKEDAKWLQKELTDALKDTGVAVKDEWFTVVESISKDTDLISWIDYEAINVALKDAVTKGFDGVIPLLQKKVESMQRVFNEMTPQGKTVTAMQEMLKKLTDQVGGKFNVSMNDMRNYLIKTGESWEDYSKRVRDSIKEQESAIDEMTKQNKAIENLEPGWGGLQYYSDEDKKKAEGILEILKLIMEYLQPQKSSGRSSQSDPRLGILKEMASDLQKINKEYQDLLKYEGETKALADAQRLYADTLKNMQSLSEKYGFALPDFQVPTDSKSLTEYLSKIREAMAKLPKSDKEVLALQYTIDKIDIDEAQKNLEKQLKRLQEKVSQTKTAKEFFDKILGQTGDVDLATTITMSIYNETGTDLFNAMVDHIKTVFESSDIEVTIPVDTAIDYTNQRIDYGKLAKIYQDYQNFLIDKNKDTAAKIVSEGQKTAAQNILNWEKELAKAKDYEEQRTDIILRESERRAEIIRSFDYTPEQKEERLQWSYDKQAKELSKINFEEFKNSESYIRIFEDLDNVSTQSLRNLRERLQEIIDTDKNLDPTNMKTLVKALDSIDNQLAERSPTQDMVQNVKDWVAATQQLKIAKTNLQTAQAEYDTQKPILDEEIQNALQEQINLQAELDGLKLSGLATDEQIVQATERVNQAETKVQLARQKAAKAAKKVADAQDAVDKSTDDAKKASTKFFKNMKLIANSCDELAGLLGSVRDLIGISSDTAEGVAFDAAITSLQQMSQLLNIITVAQVLYNAVCASNPWLAIVAAVATVAAFLGNFIAGEKVRKANKIIKEQENAVDDLSYAYDRLGVAMEKAFGSAFIMDSKRKKELLEAQAMAYDLMADAEASKGKKGDKDKIKDYKEKARELRDEVADLRYEISEAFLGTDLTSAARDFAKSWIDAYVSFEDTTEAMREKFSEMIQNMIVESLSASLIENLLKPVYNAVESAAKDGEVDEREIASIADQAFGIIGQIDDSMFLLMESLKEKGLDVQSALASADDLESNFTGIARDIASASEESINGLAAYMNTQNFYIAAIKSDVAIIREFIVGGMRPTESDSVSVTDLVTLQNTYLQHLPQIAANTAGTLQRCERAAIACEEMVENFGKVMTVAPNGKRAIAVAM